MKCERSAFASKFHHIAMCMLLLKQHQFQGLFQITTLSITWLYTRPRPWNDSPALMWTPQCVSREILDPTVFVIPTQRAPLSRQYRKAKIVSAVSPDWDTKTQTSSRKMGVLLSKKSDANSMDTGISVNSSNTARVWTCVIVESLSFPSQFQQPISYVQPNRSGMKYHKHRTQYGDIDESWPSRISARLMWLSWYQSWLDLSLCWPRIPVVRKFLFACYSIGITH